MLKRLILTLSISSALPFRCPLATTTLRQNTPKHTHSLTRTHTPKHNNTPHPHTNTPCTSENAADIHTHQKGTSYPNPNYMGVWLSQLLQTLPTYRKG